jgi:peptide/nickel transport system substrate-binding protein
VYSGDPTAVTKEASYLAEQVPGLFTPNSEYVYAVSKRVGGDPSSWYALTQLTALPQFWYLTK